MGKRRNNDKSKRQPKAAKQPTNQQRKQKREPTKGAGKGRMRAERDDPWLGVFVLTEFVFCPRAGLLAYEQQREEEEERWDPPRLNFLRRLPDSSLSAIEQRLWAELTNFGLAVAALWVSAGFFYWGGPTSKSFPMFPVILAFGCGALSGMYFFGKQTGVLLARRTAAMNAKPIEPEAVDTRQSQSINWWNFRECRI